jgi:hypothetical protein
VKGIVLAVFIGASGIAAAQDNPAPVKPQSDPGQTAPHRHAPTSASIAVPQTFAPPQEAYAGFRENTAPTPLAPSACQLRLTKIAEFQPLPLLAGPGECGAADAVLLRSVILPDQAMVAVTPPATLRCSMAEAVADWLRDNVNPAALTLGAPLRGLDDYDSYECRGRNRVRGAMLSEHGRANAIDVRGFRLGDGKEIGLTDIAAPKAWREGIRASACARFTTVLGPGSDGYHEEHIHLDLAERHGGYRLCEWEVRVPVAEAPKPEAKTDAKPEAKTDAKPEAKTDAKSEAKTDAKTELAAAAIVAPVPLPRPRPAHAPSGPAK